MEWKSVEEKPCKSKIYLVMCFSNMFYFARYDKRGNEWSRFQHFLGPINKDTWPNWHIQVRAWTDLDHREIRKLVSIPNQPERSKRKDLNNEDAVL